MMEFRSRYTPFYVKNKVGRTSTTTAATATTTATTTTTTRHGEEKQKRMKMKKMNYMEEEVLFVVMLLSDITILTSTVITCLLYTSPSPRDMYKSRMPSSA